LGSRYFSTFYLKGMHLNGNEEGMTTPDSEGTAEKQKGKTKKLHPSFYPNMTYDLAAKLHVMILHVGLGFVQQHVIQKY